MRTKDRGVTPVVGIAQLLGLTILLAAVVGGVLLTAGPPREPAPQYGYKTTFAPTGEGNSGNRPYLNITIIQGQIEVGSDFYFVDSDGNEVR